jgi:transcriptional regulator with XRE-family HTH domain
MARKKARAANPKAAGEEDVQTGRRIRLARLQAGMTQATLADQVGVSFQQIQKYEKGVNKLTVRRLREISEVLQLDPRELAELDEKPGNNHLPMINGQIYRLIASWEKVQLKYRTPLLMLIELMGQETP